MSFRQTDTFVSCIYHRDGLWGGISSDVTSGAEEGISSPERHKSPQGKFHSLNVCVSTVCLVQACCFCDTLQLLVHAGRRRQRPCAGQGRDLRGARLPARQRGSGRTNDFTTMKNVTPRLFSWTISPLNGAEIQHWMVDRPAGEGRQRCGLRPQSGQPGNHPHQERSASTESRQGLSQVWRSAPGQLLVPSDSPKSQIHLQRSESSCSVEYDGLSVRPEGQIRIWD